MSAGRPRRRDEPSVTKRADELSSDEYGCVVYHPGNRGWLRNVSPQPGGTWVCTTTGVAVYPNDAEFVVFGHAEREKVRAKWAREHQKYMKELGRDLDGRVSEP